VSFFQMEPRALNFQLSRIQTRATTACIFVFLCSFFLVPTLAAEILPVSVAELNEFRVITSKPMEQGDVEGLDKQHLAELFEHTLLAMARQASGSRLDSLQLTLLAEEHQEVAVRVYKARHTRPNEVGEKELVDYAELSRGLYFASHILLSSESDAQAVLKRLKNGESFQELARETSQDPGSAELGGDLGGVRSGDTVMEFEDCLFHLRETQVSDPLQTPFGWHLIRLDSLSAMQSDWSKEDLGTYRKRLERHARRRAALKLSKELHASHEIKVHLHLLGPGVADTTLVATSLHAELTRGTLNQILYEAFGDRVDALGPDLSKEFVKYWIERQAWLWECHQVQLFDDPEVMERMNVRERMVQSTLFVSEEIRSKINPSQEDLFNYLQNHEVAFLEHRAFGMWDFSFTTRLAASRAELLIGQGFDTPEALAEKLNLEIFPTEISADSLRSLGSELRMALVGLDPFRWSKIQKLKVERRSVWHLYYLLGRRMPLLEESESLEKAVYQTVAESFLRGEIARVLAIMQEETGLEKAQLHF
jgi:hypothetical protein